MIMSGKFSDSGRDGNLLRRKLWIVHRPAAIGEEKKDFQRPC